MLTNRWIKQLLIFKTILCTYPFKININLIKQLVSGFSFPLLSKLENTHTYIGGELQVSEAEPLYMYAHMNTR